MTMTGEPRAGHPLGADDDAGPVTARDAVNSMIEAGLLDQLMSQVDAGELALTGDGGFLPEMIKAVLERGLAVEQTAHLGYEKGDPAGRGTPNSRNGTSPKTVATEVGDVALDVPRDRSGTFEPRLVPKGSRRTGGLDEMIISLYAGGMTVRDIAHHLQRTIGTELSHDTISKITDSVLEEVKAWQSRPLEEIYPIVYLDALVIKVRDGHQVRNRSAHLAVGVDLDGVKHVLGIWVQAAEGAKFWAGVCAELRNRGVRDVLIVCCDGLSGFPEAIEATWPQSIVQTCTVHLLRAAMRFVSYADRKKVAAALRPIYTAPTDEIARTELDSFASSSLGKKYPAAVATWVNAWERFIPFLAFPPELRKIIYTTNAIESLNYQLRKIIKNRGHFPNDDAAIKLLWLAIRDIEDKRARARAKEKGLPANERKAPGRLVEGAVVQGWKQALGSLALAYPERINPYLT
ncbi:putative transposase [Pseudonocardia cypriaca]|uniref:Putative transposase n=2 Tax=Pseudonocardia cypriaca TaxID=882449 RepID=A0A543FR28_9PSEU|nr:putative transposase [Pseudonocardia cypriaca]TQM43236.1 putative transposase [Pseudonocardia cypriaca]TQM43566.1 putative transposase [Pseudonocardia cypriaca]TQM46138.1 putative transposase [Pseudonocardia cypriaca]